MTERKLKPWQGFLVAAIEIAIFIFVCAPLQMKLGMTGLLLTEIIVLSIAITAKLIFGGVHGFKETFSFNKFTGKQLGGSILIFIGSFAVTNLVALITAMLFPGIAEVSSSMFEMFTTVNKPVMFLIVAVSPAICEEMLCRGFIAHSLSEIKQEWLQVFLIGLIFGIFHLDPYRFLPTAILGAALGYMLVKTKSIFIPMIFHLVNNTMSTLSIILLSNIQESSPEMFEAAMSTQEIGVSAVLAAAGIDIGIAIVAILFGSRILRGYEANAKGFKNAVIAVSISVVLVLFGFGLNISNTMKTLMPESTGVLFENSFTSEECDMHESFSFDVSEDGEYTLTIKAKSDAESYVVINDLWGKTVYEFKGTEKEEDVNLELYVGSYTVSYDINSENVECNIKIVKA